MRAPCQVFARVLLRSAPVPATRSSWRSNTSPLLHSSIRVDQHADGDDWYLLSARKHALHQPALRESG